MSAAEQREAFQSALAEGLEDACSVEVARSIHERLTEQIARHKESKSPEPLVLAVSDIGEILRDCGVPQERINAFKENCGEKFGENAVLNPANLIDAGKFEVKTSQVTVSVSPEQSYLVETRTIDGKKYLLIPAEEDVEVNGQTVRFEAAASVSE